MNHYPLPPRPDAQINALINAFHCHGTIKEYPRARAWRKMKSL